MGIRRGVSETNEGTRPPTSAARAGASRRVSRRSVLRAGATAGALGLTGCAGLFGADRAESILIFHAGSLEPPFQAAESTFEAETGIAVNREAQGSVDSANKIIEQGREASVLGVSDFRLIRDNIIPDFGDWVAILATNAMSIQYREDSTGADDIGRDNWWEVLARDGVTIGHSDPAADPGGYRAVMAQQLGREAFEGERLYDDATYRKLRENSTVPTGTETNLKGQLRSGELDYAFYYQSISSQTDLPAIDLQPEIDLSRATSTYADHYAKASVTRAGETYTGAPIAYGITVPSNAPNPEGGARWVEYVVGGAGQQTLAEKGLQPTEPAVVNRSGADAVPANVMDHATARATLGPLELSP